MLYKSNIRLGCVIGSQVMVSELLAALVTNKRSSLSSLNLLDLGLSVIVFIFLLGGRGSLDLINRLVLVIL